MADDEYFQQPVPNSIRESIASKEKLIKWGSYFDSIAKKQNKTTVLEQYQELRFDPNVSDWVNIETDEVLSGYTLPPELANLLEYNIDSELS